MYHSPFTIHQTPYTRHHTAYTIHHTPYTKHHAPCTRYTLQEAGDLAPGTRIVLHLRREDAEFADETTVRGAVVTFTVSPKAADDFPSYFTDRLG